MGWPFTSVAAPTLDTGPGQAVPTLEGVITASQAWILGVHFKNTDPSSELTVTITNTAGDILDQIPVPPLGSVPFDWVFRPSLGVKWVADGAGILGHVWGYI
jgi:hypothetical protein